MLIDERLEVNRLKGGDEMIKCISSESWKKMKEYGKEKVRVRCLRKRCASLGKNCSVSEKMIASNLCVARLFSWEERACLSAKLVAKRSCVCC